MLLKVLSLAAFLVMAASCGALIVRGAILASEPIGILVQLAAALLLVWARVTFGRRSFHAGATPTAGGLVTVGPYAVIRHPIYAAVLLFLLPAVLSHATLPNVGLGLAVLVAVAVRIVAEERLLVQQYPAYRDYAARTARLVPYIF